MILDPDTYRIDADLSRADMKVLHEECAGKRVVEVGSGGSTIYLSQIAARLRSFETDKGWLTRVRAELERRDLDASVVSFLDSKLVLEIDEMPKADVYFIDGVSKDRARACWVERIIVGRVAPTILLHDSRRENPTNELRVFTWPTTAWLDAVHFHYHDSNFVVFRMRDKRAVYSNWWKSEGRRCRFGEGGPA